MCMRIVCSSNAIHVTFSNDAYVVTGLFSPSAKWLTDKQIGLNITIYSDNITNQSYNIILNIIY